MYGDADLTLAVARLPESRTGPSEGPSLRVAGIKGSRVERPSFEDFVAARSPALLRTAYLLTRDRALADDLLQTALAKAWSRWSGITDDPEPYVRKVLVNTYTSWWRRKWRSEVPTEKLPDVGMSGDFARADDRRAVRAALRRLPPKQRAVVVLRYIEELSEAETARVLGCSRGNVKSQLARALAKLRVDPELVESPSSEEEAS